MSECCQSARWWHGAGRGAKGGNHFWCLGHFSHYPDELPNFDSACASRTRHSGCSVLLRNHWNHSSWISSVLSCSTTQPKSLSYFSNLFFFSIICLQPIERKPLVYQPDSVMSSHSKELDNLPDEFFEVTVDDVRKRFAMLKSER